MKQALAFSGKYDEAHAEAYFHKHRSGIRRQLSNWLEQRMARRVVRQVGNPGVVLDLPCGAGRFWPMLFGCGVRRLVAADLSSAMLEVARRMHDGDGRIELVQTSAFDIALPDESADLVFCMRLLHHIGKSEDRLTILREFYRVSRAHVVVSLWVDGNYQARRRRRLEARRAHREYQNRFVSSVDTCEAEFRQAGFEVVSYTDLLPGISMWRTYLLRRTHADL